MTKQSMNMRRFVSSIRWRSQRAIVISTVRFLKSLPPSLVVKVKESCRTVGRLDYEKADISMMLDSTMQISRLDACKKEPETVQWIEQYVREGDVLYDIGANVGPYSLIALIVANRNCRVYAFEPVFSTFAALCQNVIANSACGSIIPLNIALSDRTGVLNFTSAIAPGSALGYLEGQTFRSLSPHSELVTLPVISYRLDEFVERFRIKLPNHVKLDVDGSECSVLRGFGSILNSTTIKSLMVEIDETNEESAETLDMLRDAEFRMRERHPHGEGGVANYIFARDE